jgi:hypothetical protein
MKKQQFEISIDHAMLIGAKSAFDTCLRAAVAKAIGTGSDEGSATLKISFEVLTAVDSETGELRRMPVFKYKAGYTVPMKESMDATIGESSRLVHSDDIGWMLVNGQVSMDELLAEDEPEAYRGERQLAEVR